MARTYAYDACRRGRPRVWNFRLDREASWGHRQAPRLGAAGREQVLVLSVARPWSRSCAHHAFETREVLAASFRTRDNGTCDVSLAPAEVYAFAHRNSASLRLVSIAYAARTGCSVAASRWGPRTGKHLTSLSSRKSPAILADVMRVEIREVRSGAETLADMDLAARSPTSAD